MFAVLALLTSLPFAFAGPGAWFKTSAPPAKGFESVSADFYIDPSSTWTTGYYQATQWSFQGHDVQYFGLQPRSPGGPTTGHLVYSVFGNGSTVGDPARCSGGADGGSGVSCSLDFDFEAGRWYTIESTVVETNAAGRRRWNGTLVDDTGARTYIASFYTDSAYGGLGPSVAQWLEWYPFNGDTRPPAQKEPCQPWYHVRYRNPRAGDVVATAPVPFEGTLDDKCANDAGKSNYNSTIRADGTLEIFAGFLS